MNLKLIRTRFEEEYTEGELYIDGKYFCKTLEDKDRGVSNNMSIEEIKSIKVYGKTAIPTGIFKINMNIKSPTFSKKAYYRDFCDGFLPRLEKVNGFTGILIHRGKTHKNTLGCILVGKDVNNGVLSNTQEVFEELYGLLDKANKNKEEIWIDIC